MDEGQFRSQKFSEDWMNACWVFRKIMNDEMLQNGFVEKPNSLKDLLFFLKFPFYY